MTHLGIRITSLVDGRLALDLPGDDPLPLVRMAREGKRPVAEGVDGRLVAGVQQDDDRADDLVVRQPTAVDLRLGERGDHVVPRRGPALPNQLADVLLELGRRPVRSLGGLDGNVELVHLDHAM